ncbi:MAG: hypothetical protein HY704_00375 [Gemmatimonadetes bacterium]|nr:hypothetical protein [Gemmatimonadota bacterium]
MSIHDRYARLTPFELAFAANDFAGRRFPAIRDQVEAGGHAPVDPEAFLTLSAVADALGEIMGTEADAAAVPQYGALLYHGYQFWRHDGPLYLLETDVARSLVEAKPVLAGWEAAPAAPAGYVQLPQHLFWARIVDAGPAESLDGFFWSVTGAAAIGALLVLGLRGDRPGLSAVPLLPLGAEDLRELSMLPAREQGRDFETTLPGGEMERLYSLETVGEAVKLVARALWYLEHFPEALRREEPAAAGPGELAELAEPAPSRLPFYRVSLERAAGERVSE